MIPAVRNIKRVKVQSLFQRVCGSFGEHLSITSDAEPENLLAPLPSPHRQPPWYPVHTSIVYLALVKKDLLSVLLLGFEFLIGKSCILHLCVPQSTGPDTE